MAVLVLRPKLAAILVTDDAPELVGAKDAAETVVPEGAIKLNDGMTVGPEGTGPVFSDPVDIGFMNGKLELIMPVAPVIMPDVVQIGLIMGKGLPIRSTGDSCIPLSAS